MINSNGRLFIKINDSKQLNTFDFYNFASVPSITYNTKNAEFIKTNKNGKTLVDAVVFEQDVNTSFSLKTYLFDNNSLLKYLAENNITADFQIHYGSSIHPNSFLEYNTILYAPNCVVNGYTINNLLALTSSDSGNLEENVDINGINLYLINKPKVLNINLVNQTPIIKLLKVDDMYFALKFTSVDNGADTQLSLLYSKNNTWSEISIATLLGGNVNPYNYDIKYYKNKLYILNRTVALNNVLYIVSLTSTSEFDVDVVNVSDLILNVNLELALITTMELVDNFLIFGNINGDVLRFNINTYEQTVYSTHINAEITNSCLYNNKIYFSCNNGYIIIFNLLSNSFSYYKFGTNNFETIVVQDDKLYLSTNTKLFYSTDFSTLTEFSNVFTSIKDIKFFDKNIGYLCDGNRIYKTLDGGFTWEFNDINYNIIGIELTDTNVLIYGTSEELGTTRFNSTINNDNQTGYGNLMV